MKIFNKITEYINPKNKFQLILEVLSYLLFALTMFSIPACSFTPGIIFITWIFSILFIVDISLLCLLFYKIRIDFINLSFVLFSICAFLSTVLSNGFESFVFTPIILTVFTAVVYTYCVSNKKSQLPLLVCAFIGIFGFMILYLVKYLPDIVRLDFNRLGEAFGDENDIALFLTFGALLGYCFIFKTKKVYLKVILSIIVFIFLLCGFTTGSKIFLVELLVCGITGAFMVTKKEKWWIIIVSVVGAAGLITGIIFMPFAKVARERFGNMLITIFNPEKAASTYSYDVSTKTRFVMFLDGITLFLRRPLFGYGVQGFFRVSSFGFCWSHNNISESLCNFGLLGTFFFHFGLIYSLVKFFKVKNKTREDVGFFLVMLFFIVSMISVALNSQKIYAFVIGICIAKYSSIKYLIEFGFNGKKFEIKKYENS